MEQDLAVIGQEAEQLVKSIGIPPCPAILTALVREMRCDDPDFGRIAALISGDVGLAAAMLKTVNSPFYGLHTKATTVQQALALLGLRTVTHLITGLLLRQAFPVADSRFMERFWDLSSRIASVCAQLTRRVRSIDRDEAHTYGLFRDCGIPPLMLKFPGYARALAALDGDSARSIIEIDEEHCGIDHAEIGHYLGKSWYLSEQVALAILWHHDHAALSGKHPALPAASVRLIALGMAAEHVLRTYREEPLAPEWQRGGALALEHLDLSAQDFAEVAGEIQQAFAGN
ncbi:MAG: HDOD domain-containing protein [Burkholderiales bacterium]